jgi:hypothetical protein
MKKEKIITPFNGYLAVVIIVILMALMVYGADSNNTTLTVSLLPVTILLIKGLIVISPNTFRELPGKCQAKRFVLDKSFLYQNESFIACAEL